MPFSGRVDLDVGATINNPQDLDGNAKLSLTITKAIVLADGIDAGEANLMWYDTRSILATSDDDLDLTGGLTNGINQTLTFARVKFIYVFPKPDNLGEIRIGAATDPFSSWLDAETSFVRARPGGLFMLIAPDVIAYPVVVGNDILRISNPNATGVSYDIALFGSSV